ncbi:hypothetical protein FGRMN_5397 [Fusarium graminum]|nr:hypothetical protein FGRMN_5397 [Fusarium graminum]
MEPEEDSKLPGVIQGSEAAPGLLQRFTNDLVILIDKKNGNSQAKADFNGKVEPGEYSRTKNERKAKKGQKSCRREDIMIIDLTDEPLEIEVKTEAASETLLKSLTAQPCMPIDPTKDLEFGVGNDNIRALPGCSPRSIADLTGYADRDNRDTMISTLSPVPVAGVKHSYSSRSSCSSRSSTLSTLSSTRSFQNPFSINGDEDGPTYVDDEKILKTLMTTMKPPESVQIVSDARKSTAKPHSK